MKRARHLDQLLGGRSKIIAHDLAMVIVAWFGAYWLRFDFTILPAYWDQVLTTLPVMLIAQAGAIIYFGLHRALWEYVSVPDLVRILKAVVVGLCVGTSAIFLLIRLEYVPRSVFALYSALLVLLLVGPRLVRRIWKENNNPPNPETKRAVVVGAGAAGEMLVRDLLRSPCREYFPVGYVDDDPMKHGRDIQGVPILGDVPSIPELVHRTRSDLVLIAVPSATSAQMQRIINICEKTEAILQTLPALSDIVNDDPVTSSSLRPLLIEDLLAREPILLDWDALRRSIAGQKILVTGGGGSIGSELCRQIARLDPRCLVVMDNNEHNLFSIETELRDQFPRLKLNFVLGDVCHAPAVQRTFARFPPDIVFHAAAYKHVPMLEREIREAVRVNVFGTECVGSAAAAAGTERFVLVSTDKAVNPANTMGASKRAAEIICSEWNHTSVNTRFITVRFGNVLGSSGSVVPLFRRQIENGGPVTVTHPEVRRYFMTVTEACQLVLKAGSVGKGGEIFVFDMGEPVKIAYLAKQMIRLAGKIPGKDMAIEFVGLRPGEKLSEELHYAEESLTPTQHKKLLVARAIGSRALGVARILEELRNAVASLDETRIGKHLMALVPEWRTGARKGAFDGLDADDSTGAEDGDVIPIRTEIGGDSGGGAGAQNGLRQPSTPRRKSDAR